MLSPRLTLLAIDRFDAEPFSFELSDNRELLTESLSSTGKSNFGIVFYVKSDSNRYRSVNKFTLNLILLAQNARQNREQRI